jgi:ferritin
MEKEKRMAMNPDVKKALHKQINMEFQSSYLYLGMAADFFAKNLAGFGAWMLEQAGEEKNHGQKIFRHLVERGETIALDAIEAPPKSWASPLEAFQAALAHERKVTASIGALTELAREKKDHAAEIFLQWFVTEQVEEEANADAIVHMLELAKDNAGALFMIDRELGRRGKA